MKLNFKHGLLLLAAIVITYTSCKKLGGDTPSSATLSNKDVSSQVALNITQALNGGLGGFNMGDGLSMPTTLSTGQRGRSVNDANLDGLLCGLSIDTTLTYTEKLTDTTDASISGKIKFSILCNNDELTGISTAYDLTVTANTPKLNLVYKLAENLVLQMLDPKKDDGPLVLNGTVNLALTTKIKATSKTRSESYNFVFKDIKLDPNTGEITSGSATFATKGTNAKGSWDCQGTIEFLGNKKAKITINSASYTVNLETGQIV